AVSGADACSTAVGSIDAILHKSRPELGYLRRHAGGSSSNMASVPDSEPPDSGLTDVGSLDQERDPDVGAVLVEVLAPDAGADDVDRADVPQRCLGLLQRLHRRIVAGRLRATHQLDDLDYGHSLLLFVAALRLVAARVLSGTGPRGKPG